MYIDPGFHKAIDAPGRSTARLWVGLLTCTTKSMSIQLGYTPGRSTAVL